MIEVESKTRRRRGASPRGDFETAKFVTTVSEDARVAADKKRRKHCVRPGGTASVLSRPDRCIARSRLPK